MDTLKVNINRDQKSISVYNNGRGIPIEIHSKEGIWIPELIFGNLLTSSNYDDDERKVTGGRNGFGAKLANIYSTEFTVETADSNTHKKYKQVFTNNMSIKGKPNITANKKGDDWTRITFKPDFKLFNMEEIDDDTFALISKRVYDMAGITSGVKVYLNDERLKINGFKKYIEMYTTAQQEAVKANAGDNDLVGASETGAAPAKPTVIYERFGERWEVGFAVSEGQFQQVSFVNSIATTKGGTHVNHVAEQVRVATQRSGRRC